MKNEDKEAFEKWFASLDDSHLSRVIKLNRGASQEAYQAAITYKNQECSNIMDAMTRTSQNNAKLQAENAKLRECVEFYADLDEEAIGYDIRGVTYARQVLKELDEKI